MDLWFKKEDIYEYSKKDLIDFWIKFRTLKKELEDNIKLINMVLMEEYDIDKERHWDFNVFTKQVVSYSKKKWYNYKSIMIDRPDLFEPSKARMFKEYPDAIDRKLTTTIEMSKDKDYNKK